MPPPDLCNTVLVSSWPLALRLYTSLPAVLVVLSVSLVSDCKLGFIKKKNARFLFQLFQKKTEITILRFDLKSMTLTLKHGMGFAVVFMSLRDSALRPALLGTCLFSGDSAGCESVSVSLINPL